MRLLLANPNTTAAITAHMAGVARGMAAAGTEIVEATAAFGAAVIGTRVEMAVAEHAVLSLLSEARLAEAGLAEGGWVYDGVIIGASLDSGLRAARAMLPCPVLGLTEAALHTACLVGGRFGVITTSAEAAVITREMIAGYGLERRLAGLRWVGMTATQVLADAAGAAAAMAPLVEALVKREQAEAVVLIGAVMAGVPELLRPYVGVPVLEGVSCAVPLLEGLVRLGLGKATAGTYRAAPGSLARF